MMGIMSKGVEKEIVQRLEGMEDRDRKAAGNKGGVDGIV